MFRPRCWLTFFMLSLLVMSITLYVFGTKVKAAEALGGEATTTFASGQGFLTTGNLKGDDYPVVIWTDKIFGGGTVSMVPATGGATVTLASGQRLSQNHTIFLASGQGFVSDVTTGNLKGDDDPVVIWTTSSLRDDTVSMVSAVGGNVQVLLSNVKSIEGIAVGDFNGDGKLDVVVSSSPFRQGGVQKKGTIWMLLGNGDGSFQLPHTYSVDAPLGDLVVDDFNSDGKLDIAISSWIDGTIWILLGNGDGTFQFPHTYSVGSYFSPNKIVVGDFNSDGKLDIATVNSNPIIDLNNTISVLLGNGDGTFQPAKTTSLPADDIPTALVAGDFGGNGKLAIAVAVYTFPSGGAKLLMLRGNGDGTFQSPTEEVILPKVGLIADMTIDSFKRNKKLSIYWIESNGKVRELISNGDGTFQRPRTLALTSNDVARIVVGDFGKAVQNVASGDGDTVDEPYSASLY